MNDDIRKQREEQIRNDLEELKKHEASDIAEIERLFAEDEKNRIEIEKIHIRLPILVKNMFTEKIDNGSYPKGTTIYADFVIADIKELFNKEIGRDCNDDELDLIQQTVLLL